MKRIYAGLLFAFMCGCASQPVQTNYDPLTQARIRVYKGPLVHISQTMTHGRLYFDASAPSLPNRTIGMPIPKNAYTDMLARFAGHFGYVPYREYAVPANKQLTIVSELDAGNATVIGGAVFQGTPNVLCRQTAIQFTPQAGKDYDFTVVPVPFHAPECKLHLRGFVSEGGELTAVPIPYTIVTP